MKLSIVDASVAVKWFLAEEYGRDEALDLLDRIRDTPVGFAVPELFFNEMLAVLVRLLPKSAATVRRYLEALESLGLERIGNGHQLLARAADLGCRYGLSGYDSIYAASAQLTSGCWLTADAKAHHKIRRLRISRLVCVGPPGRAL